MVPRQDNFRLDMSAASVPSSSGLICNSGQLPTPRLCFPLPRRGSNSDRRALDGLESLGSNLPFSSLEHNSGSNSLPRQLPRDRSSNRSSLRDLRVVPEPDSEMSEEIPTSSQIFTQSTYYSRYSSPPKQFSLAASRLDALTQALRAKGFSALSLSLFAKSHKASTLRQYQSVWVKFRAFLDFNQVYHGDVNEVVVFNFLAFHVVVEKRQYRTIATYRCALKLPFFIIFNIILDGVLSDCFMRGVFNFKPPQKHAPMPSWSLNTLLAFLKSGEFEPLEEVAWRRLIQKCLCLLLLASGRRIGEIANLSKISHWDLSSGSLFLDWLPSFTPKHFNASFQPDCPSIEAIRSDDPDVSLLCPFRAYSIFLNRIAESPGYRVNESLWGKVGKASITFLTKQLKILVRDSRMSIGIFDDVTAGPHHFRKLAASYSAKMFSSVNDEIRLKKKLGCSAKSKILNKVYIKEVPPLGTHLCVTSGYLPRYSLNNKFLGLGSFPFCNLVRVFRKTQARSLEIHI